jgi:hypothetical protein
VKRVIRFTYILLAFLIFALPVLAAYPYSQEQGIEPPEQGALMEGELFGTESFSHSDHDNYERAWDGDPHTFFDPTHGQLPTATPGWKWKNPTF